MQIDAAHNLIVDAFENPYDEARVRRFVQNLLVEADMKTGGHRSGQMVYESFREHVSSYKRLAKFTDRNGEEMDILSVKLKTPHKLERARTMQRNFAATYLKDPDRHGREAALVAYHADGTDDWRLSFVQMEYRTVMGEDGTVTAEEELTPVRYTFLVGPNEPTHTPKRQFAPLLQSDELPFPPTLEDLKEAFDIEVVTDEFFDSYREHYKTLTDEVGTALNEYPTAQAEFDDKGVTAAAFAEKLMGQLVFLYFLQKKGWLGVQRGDEWGEGPTDLLRQLYEGEYINYNNFYQDVLEPLFYQGLAVDRGGDNYFSALRCRVPFLNGGLFQPIQNVDRSRVHLPLPNDTFGAIFDTFDRYNFTVREDEPLDKEVAVDPEMLGKVFEKLLLDERQKELGAFYTPRDIVHYMCQQSLVDHLDTELNVRETPLTSPEPQQQNAFGYDTAQQGVLSGEDYNPQVERHHLEALVRDGAGWVEHDRRVRESESTNGKYSGYEAPRPIREHAQAIDAVLSDVRVCDPAVGSGAFPVGMMKEIVQARQVLDTYIDDEIEREAYPLKRHAIQHSLHGVDIDLSAIDIAQLRLWLSLVVDEEDFEDIRPLPNLRYKFVQGDALQKIERNVFNNEQEARLHELMENFVDTAHPSEKEELQEQIDDNLDDLLKDGQFDFGLYFGTVFKEQNGFDIVIGNPPYVTSGNLTDQQKDALKDYEVHKGRADYCTYFVERGINLLRPDGELAYIIKNKWLRAKYGDKLRSWLKGRQLSEIIDFKDLPVFQGVIAYPCIFRAVNASSDGSLQAVEVEHLDYDDLAAYVAENRYEVKQSQLREECWSLATPNERELLSKLRETGVSLNEAVNDSINYGIKTGCNAVFKIDSAKRQQLIDTHESSQEVIKPFLTGRNAYRYTPPQNDSYVIFTRRGIDIDAYPAVKEYLSEHKERLKPKPKDWEPPHEDAKWPGRKSGSYAWYEIQDAVDYHQAFEDTKIIYSDLSVRGSFTLDKSGIYPANTLYIIADAGLYLLGLLNSRLAGFYYIHHFATYRGSYLRFFKDTLRRLPVVPRDDAPQDLREEIESHAQTLLDLHDDPEDIVDARSGRILREEKALDEAVYGLYGLTSDEVQLVEQRVPAVDEA